MSQYIAPKPKSSAVPNHGISGSHVAGPNRVEEKRTQTKLSDGTREGQLARPSVDAVDASREGYVEGSASPGTVGNGNNSSGVTTSSREHKDDGLGTSNMSSLNGGSSARQQQGQAYYGSGEPQDQLTGEGELDDELETEGIEGKRMAGFQPAGNGGKGQRQILKEGEIPSNCVWVGNVAPDVPDETFRKAFEEYGEVSLIRRFPSSKCAFVTFKLAAYAIKSLALEGRRLGSMELTLNVGKACPHLWVGNIGSHISEDELREVFAKFGAVDNVRILSKNSCAFVNFFNEKDALKAMEALNGTEVGGQKILINFKWMNQPSSGKRKGGGGGRPPMRGGGVSHSHNSRNQGQQSMNMSMGQGQGQMQQQQVGMSQGGQRSSVGLTVNSGMQHMGGYAQVTQGSLGQTMQLQHHQVQVQATPTAYAPTTYILQPQVVQHQPRPQIPQHRGYPQQNNYQSNVPSRQLFVGNISSSATEKDLFDLFSRFGQVEEIRSFANRGYAFVVYGNLDHAVAVRESMAVYPALLQGRSLVINYGRPLDDKPQVMTQTVTQLIPQQQQVKQTVGISTVPLSSLTQQQTQGYLVGGTTQQLQLTGYGGLSQTTSTQQQHLLSQQQQPQQQILYTQQQQTIGQQSSSNGNSVRQQPVGQLQSQQQTTTLTVDAYPSNIPDTQTATSAAVGSSTGPVSDYSKLPSFNPMDGLGPLPMMSLPKYKLRMASLNRPRSDP